MALDETQVWQWVKREPGKPAACREHTFHRSQPGDALLQKLQAIAFTLEEEDRLSLPDVTRRARAGFDVERVTKRFYERFQKEHAAFLKFITGITETPDREWYVSVMLNRLMFVYFIQRKGFLDGDRDYLRNRLTRMRAEHGKDKFYSFYRYFLLRLFHEGLGGRTRTPELEKLVGRIPYLNGGLFDVHELERADRYGKSIQIPDQAFERIFDFFDQYQWHLDERPLRADNEINPDVLGYIFEKYINQKQMGAYYTKEDITEYISKNTVLPFLFDAARAKCKVAFENPKGPTVWDHAEGRPRPLHLSCRSARCRADRYRRRSPQGSIRRRCTRLLVTARYKPLSCARAGTRQLRRPTLCQRRHGGSSSRDVGAMRKSRPSSPPARYGTSTTSSPSTSISGSSPRTPSRTARARICSVPSGMRSRRSPFSIPPAARARSSSPRSTSSNRSTRPASTGWRPSSKTWSARARSTARRSSPTSGRCWRSVAAHPNRRYFIFKSIILNNLFGVDIMEEAVEICKLRLFLKLAAQVEPDSTRDNLGIEPSARHRLQHPGR